MATTSAVRRTGPRPAEPQSEGDRSVHPALVRVTHWLATILSLALLITGLEILISHPRFYWGETGNVQEKPILSLPIPASRSAVPTGYSFVLPDQNGWSRALHFESAWLIFFTGVAYVFHGVFGGHFRRRLIPARRELSLGAMASSVQEHLPFRKLDRRLEGASRYNALQQVSYLLVIFGLFPFLGWTGLAMSPAFTAAVPLSVQLLGGQQSARTLHFAATLALVAFVGVHVWMICRAGFRRLMRAMLIGR